ncbi:MAG: polyphosphate polymerase domain-containing protein [Lachnospiraceae bacterium]|nr:polyphosphate polymerase domain-containing protein [Lachnospiraceae bacterium]
MYRNELKYLCSEKQLRMLELRIRHICKPDAHAGADGRYTVRSAYFDDYADSCYYENEDGVNQRRKYRLRLYDGDPAFIQLECKQKVNGRNHKDACRISAELCSRILQGHFQLPAQAPPVLARFYVACATRGYRPKVIVEYERTPFVYRMGNVRITFDRNISATSKVQDFMQQKIHTRPLMQEDLHLLEVKYDELLPDYIYSQLQLDNLQLVANSKYYTARRLTKEYCI